MVRTHCPDCGEPLSARRLPRHEQATAYCESCNWCEVGDGDRGEDATEDWIKRNTQGPRMMNHPQELEWIDGDLPDVHTVPYNCCLLVWFGNDITQEEWERCAKMSANYPSMIPPKPERNGELRRITMCHPWKNELNPLRWCDSSGMPVGYHEKAMHYAWVVRGSVEDVSST